MTKKHKVFISFQHGCTKDRKPCTEDGLKECNGDCDFFTCTLGCSNYSICGHYWKHRFEHLMSTATDSIISKSVQDGDIKQGNKTETTRQIIRDEYISDASVTVVLIGPDSWKRKHVDWEISSSIKKTKNNSRCGLIGILLPTYPDYNKDKNTYIGKTIPPRLQKNIDKKFASIHVWNENPKIVQGWIHEAFLRRNEVQPDNSYPLFSNNRPENSSSWQ